MPADYTWFKEGGRNFVSKNGKWYKRDNVVTKSYDLHDSGGKNFNIWNDMGVKPNSKIIINLTLVPKSNLDVLFNYYANGSWATPSSDYLDGTGMLLSANSQWRAGDWAAHQGVSSLKGYPLTWQRENDWTLRKDFVQTLEIQVLPVSSFTTVIKWDINYKAHNNRIGLLEGIVRTDIGLSRIQFIAINFSKGRVAEGRIHVDVL
jgi:hypothetical protein